VASECEPGEGRFGTTRGLKDATMAALKKKRDDFVPKGMEHSDFKIGREFLTETGRWRCTDVGKRIIAAIKLDHDDDSSRYNGPPYAVAEHVFDEYDIEGLSPAPGRRTYDDSGRSAIVTVRRVRPPGSRKALKKQPK
jgi:hypothetical protein